MANISDGSRDGDGHPSISACASIIIGALLEVCNISSTKEEEMMEEEVRNNLLPLSIHLCSSLHFHGSH